MKYNFQILVLLLICITFSCKRKSNILIIGTVDRLDETLVKVTSADYTKTYDSTTVKNNRFRITVQLPEDGFYQLDFSSKIPYKKYPWSHPCLFYAANNASYLFTSSGPSEILYNTYNFSSSSPDQNKLNEFNNMVKLIRDTVTLQRSHYLKLSDKALISGSDALYQSYLDTVTRMDDRLRNAYLSGIYQFIGKNPNTLITPYLMGQVPDLFERYTFYKKVLDGLSPKVKQTKYYDEAAGLSKSVRNIYIGANAPVIAGKTINGKEFKADYTTKKIILVDFWASYCAPCRQQVPELKALYKKYKNQGLDIISISIDEDPKQWERASAIDSLSWHNVAECVAQNDSKNIKNFVIKSIPANYVINNKGQLIGRNVGLDSLEKMLKKKG